MEGTYWFRRFCKEAKALSPHIRIVKLKLGFYRIYFKNHFLMECYNSMPPNWRNIEDYDPRLESQKYYEEYEDHVKMVRTLKNFLEGYYDSIQKLKRCLWMLRHNEEFWKRSGNIYNFGVIK